MPQKSAPLLDNLGRTAQQSRGVKTPRNGMPGSKTVGNSNKWCTIANQYLRHEALHEVSMIDLAGLHIETSMGTDNNAAADCTFLQFTRLHLAAKVIKGRDSS